MLPPILSAAVAAALLGAIPFAAAPASAQQPSSGGSRTVAPQRLILQPPPADLAAPAPATPRLARPNSAADCAPAWPCQMRLFGFTGKYGGVGLKAPALTW